jgi:energy-coupling factor transporter ATP-binding protein EcfA2
VNPFSTRFTQPGAIAFRFSSPDGLAGLVSKLEATNGWGQIVGPHGSGKSTLLASLLPALTGWTVRHVRLDTSHRTLPPDLFDAPDPGSLLVIDGFEQLGVLSRFRVKRHCRLHGCGLLVTAHRSVGLPDLHRTNAAAHAADLIAALVPPGGGWALDGFDIAARLRHHRGSLRDVLFELYDRWERGR